MYRADQDVDDVFELYQSRVDGTSNVKLNAPLPTGLSVSSFIVR